MWLKKQNGAGTLFFIFFLFLFALFLYVAWILLPIYMENFSVKQALSSMDSKDVIKSGQSFSANKQNVYVYLGKMFRVNNVRHATFENVKIKRQGRLYSIEIAYEVRKHLFGNVDLLLSFDDTSTVEAN